MLSSTHNNQLNAEFGLFEINLTDWWKSEFTCNERNMVLALLEKKGFNFFELKLKAILNNESFQIIDESVIPLMENLSIWCNQYPELSRKIFLKFLDVAKLDPIADCAKLENDKLYRNWFTLRHLSLYNIHNQRKMGVESAEFNDGSYENAPDACKQLSGKSYNFNCDLDFIISHWCEFKPTCRCILLPNYEDILID
jgi:hypothetical protein